jgi:hypothetical protein
MLKENKWKSTLFWLEKIQLITFLFGFLLESRMFHETLLKVVFYPPMNCFSGDFLFEYSDYLLINILIGGMISVWVSIISYRNNTLGSKSRFLMFSPIYQLVILVVIIVLWRYNGTGYELFYGNETYEYIYSLIPKIAIYSPHNLFVINYL